MKTISAFVKGYPLVVFVLLAYLLSWSIAIFVPGVLLPWGPMVAALIVVGLSDGKVGVKAWWSRVVRRDMAWGWVLLAAFPLVITLTADWVRQSWLLGVLWTLLALGVLSFTGLQLGRKPVAASHESKLTEPAFLR